MRKFRNVSLEQQKKLESQFSGISEIYENGDKLGFEKAFVSVFDHWLTREEVEKDFNELSALREMERDKRLHDFCCSLTKEHKPYLVKFKGRYKSKIVFKEFLSTSAREKSIFPLGFNYGDRWRFILVFPSLDLLYFEGCDFTHMFYFRECDKLKSLKNIATSCGVHVL